MEQTNTFSTIDQIFGALTMRLMGLVSCRLEIALADTDKIFAPIIKQVFSFPPAHVLVYIDAALYSINEIETLGIKTLDNYLRPDKNGIIDDELGNFYAPEQVEKRKQEVLNNYIIPEIAKYKADLLYLKQSMIDRSNLLNTTTTEKIKLNLTVEEIAILFRGLLEMGIIIDIKDRASLCRQIIDSFYVKRSPNMSFGNLQNQMTKMDTVSTANVKKLLEDTSKLLNKFIEK